MHYSLASGLLQAELVLSTFGHDGATVVAG